MSLNNFLTIVLVLSVTYVFGQSEEVIKDREFQPEETPLNGIVKAKKKSERMVLAYAPIEERDILWQKRIQRELDTREKMNLTFRYPVEPFFSILKTGIETGELKAYANEAGEYVPMQTEELALQFYSKDTVQIIDPETGALDFEEVQEEINPLDVKRFRLDEVWFFDSQRSTMRQRILWIAPIYEVYDKDGKFLYEYPLFWIYYPHAREFLANHFVMNEMNDKNTMSWEDLFEMRFFASYIIKESNVHDRRLKDYLQGRDMLLESERIKLEILNKEQDLWSY